MKNKKPILILLVCAYAAFLATFNETFLNIAFTPIMKDLNISISTVQWLTTAYMLGAAIMVPISSFLYRRFNTKSLFLFTVSLLIIGSVVCALASDFSILLIGRIIQSIGTGMLIPIGMNLTLSVVPKEKIGTYMGVMGAMTTLGPSLSIIAAGVLLSLSSWHLLFIVFAILTTLLFILGLILLGKTEHNKNVTIDYASVSYISLALIGLLYGISTIFSGNILIALFTIIFGSVFLILFIRRQLKIKEPLINLEILKVKAFRIGLIINMLALMLIFATNIILPIFIQGALNTKAFTASIVLFPAIVCSCVIAPIAGKLYDKKGAKHIISLGFLMMLIFILTMAITRNINSLFIFALLYIPIIIGSAFIIGPIQSFALSNLKRNQNPDGVTLMSTGFQIAGCIGTSIFTGVYALVHNISITNNINNYNSMSNAFFVTLLVAVLLSLIGLLLSLKIKKIESKKENINLELRDIMKKDVYTINDNASLLDALKTITDKKVSGVPVVNNKNDLVGFVSDGDIIKYLSNSHPLFINAYSFTELKKYENNMEEKLNILMQIKVKDIIKKKIITVDINTSLDKVCTLLNNKKLKKIPVLENGKMIGIINRSNITKYAINCYLSLRKNN